MNTINAISPIDGRYHSKTNFLSEYFSEFALIKYRVRIEIEYLSRLSKTLHLEFPNELDRYLLNFTEENAKEIKKIEAITNHDVKAVEYFLKEKCNDQKAKEFIHFGLTSQDVNNMAIPLMLKEWLSKVYIPRISSLLIEIGRIAHDWRNQPMLARTHGQPASPTKLGKEMLVFLERLTNQVNKLDGFVFKCKFGGATGNFNAHKVAYPNINWAEFADDFATSLDLSRSQFTTQIDHYDNLAELFDCLKRINVILIDFCRDIWQYISMDYFKQQTNPNEVGSSAMPHKVNPIDFENAEGNLGIANAIFNHFCEKLPISRLQRDLTDSTVLRNIGVPIAHTHVSIESIKVGISKLILNPSRINQDLNDNWSVVAEAIQTILRRENYPNPYEKLKELTRGNIVNSETIHQFIDGLDVSDDVKHELKNITPFNYTGI